MRDRNEEKLFRVYVSDTLRMVAENTAKFAQGSYPASKYSELLKPKPVETRTPEEVKNYMLQKLKGG